MREQGREHHGEPRLTANEPANKPQSRIDKRRKHARKAPGPAYASKRETLIQTAASVFRDRGLEAASMNDIANESGVDRATIYYYFKDKHEIFTAVIAEAVTDNVSRAEAIATGAGTPTDKIKDLIVALLESYEAHYPYLFVYMQEDMAKLAMGNAGAEHLAELGRRYHYAIENTIRSGVDTGDFPSSVDPRLATYFLLGSLNWTHRWFTPGEEMNVRKIADSFVELAIEGLHGPVSTR